MEQDRTWLLLSLSAFVVRLRQEEAAQVYIPELARRFYPGNSAGFLGVENENGTRGEGGKRDDRNAPANWLGASSHAV